MNATPSRYFPDFKSLGLALVAGLGYALCMAMSFNLAGDAPSAYPIWLSEGFALGFWHITRGHVRWPQLLAIFVGSVVHGFTTSWLWPVIYTTALINTLQLAGGVAVLDFVQQRFRGNWRGIPRFAGLIIGVLLMVNGLSAAMTAALFVVSANADFATTFVRFFVSDGLGIVLMAPLMAAWLTREESRVEPFDVWKVIEFAAMLLGLVAASYTIFTMRPDAFGVVAPLFYLVVPFVLWGAARFGLRGATLALVVCSFVAIYFTMQNLGPFVSGYIPTQKAVVHLQGFLTVLAVSTLLASALLIERRTALANALDMEHRYFAAIEASENLLFEVRFPQGSFILSGDVPTVLGWQVSDLATVEAWTEKIHPDDRANVLSLRTQLLEGKLASVSLEYRLARPDGRYMLLGVTSYNRANRHLLADGKTKPQMIVGFIKDITAKREEENARLELEAELRQAQKMEAIGQLAGGIAHDFNNILASILGYGELAKQKVVEGTPIARYLDTIMKAGERGRVLVSQILTFSRRTPGARVAVNVSHALEEVVTLVRGSTTHTLLLTLDDTQAPMIVAGDATELHQLFMNLVTNGVQAMPQGGTIALRAGPVTLVAPLLVAQDQLPPGDYIQVSVMDRGVGIDFETQARMFEPFFTTKATGKGTGLGLSLAMAITKAHRGGIVVESAPNVGSTFHVYLPADPDAALAPAALAETMPRGDGELILLADDEEALRELAEEILVDLGYAVASYPSAVEALAAFERKPDAFAAVLTDEVMPGMTGTEFAARLHAKQRHLPIIIITAYGGPGFELRAQEAGVMRVLKKPYQPRVLASALESALKLAKKPPY